MKIIYFYFVIKELNKRFQSSKFTSKHLKETNKKQLNNYIETINDYLHEKLPLSASWQCAVSTLSKYLNQYDFINHEGIEINDDTINDFITRIKSENKNDDLVQLF